MTDSPISLFLLDSASPLGRFPRILDSLGASYQIIRPDQDLLPSHHSPAIIFGGRMNALDTRLNPWIGELRTFIAKAVTAGTPVMGLCLGAQLGGVALGGEVTVDAPGQFEEGLISLTYTPTAIEDPWLRPALDATTRWQQNFDDGSLRIPGNAVSHYDAVTELPTGASLLASSIACPNHAWRYGSFLGFQHHPEAGVHEYGEWCASTAREAGKNEDQARAIGEKAALEVSPIQEAFARGLLMGFRRDC